MQKLAAAPTWHQWAWVVCCEGAHHAVVALDHGVIGVRLSQEAHLQHSSNSKSSSLGKQDLVGLDHQVI